MKRLSCLPLLAVAIFLLPGFANDPAVPGSPAHMQEVQQQIEAKATATQHERQKRMLDKAAEAAGKAAAAIDAGDKDEAKHQSQFAIFLLAEAARECADVTPLANQLADAYEAQGFWPKGGAEGAKRLFHLVDVLKKAQASTDAGSFQYASAIREVIAAIYDYTNHGFDYWRVSKALKWLIWTTLSRGYSETAIAELLDYLEYHDDLGPEKKAEILDDIRELAEKVEEETRKLEEKGGSRLLEEETAEVKRILEEIREEGRRRSEARKARYREEARREEEEERRQQMEEADDPKPLQPMPEPTTAVQLTSLEAPTEVSRGPIGDVQSIHILAVDGTELKDREPPAFDDHKDTFTIKVPWDPKIGSVLFGGSAGHLVIFQDRWSSDQLPHFGPRDLEIVTRNGTVNETLATRSPGGDGLTGGPLEDYGITFDGQPVEIIAAQPGEVAVQGTGVQPNPTGKSDVVLTDRGLPIASGQFDSWGYDITSTEVTQRDQWTPIYFRSIGVEPTQRLKITLTPTEGQTIEPRVITVTGIETEETIQIAQLRTAILGPQVFFATVEKVD